MQQSSRGGGATKGACSRAGAAAAAAMFDRASCAASACTHIARRYLVMSMRGAGGYTGGQGRRQLGHHHMGAHPVRACSPGSACVLNRA